MRYTRFRDIPQLTRSGSYRVNVSWDYLEDHLAHWNERDLLDLDPDFQRCHVWNDAKQQRYVEYILRGGKSSRDIYFNSASWMKGFDTPIELVDGKQRLEAVRKFLRNDLVIFDGSLYGDFTDKMRMAGPDFIFNMNDLATRAEVLQFYVDLNDGGVAHTSEEIEKVRKLLEIEQKKLTKPRA